MSPILITFYFLSAITLATAFLTIYSKNPIHSAIYLVICFFTIAGHYLLFNAQFLAIVHVIVYAGAIMVLFLFTIMLMNLNKEDEVHKPRITRLGAITVFILMSVVLVTIFRLFLIRVKEKRLMAVETFAEIAVLFYVAV